MKRLATTLIPVLVLALTASGCFYSREMVRVKRDIERTYSNVEFDRGISMRFGPGTLRTLGWLARRVPEEESQMASDYLREIKSIKVAYYPVDRMPPLDEVDTPMLRRFERAGWEVAVKVREDDDLVWVLYRERFDTVRDLYVVVLSDDELVMASINGHLDRLFRLALEDHNAFIDEIDMW